MAHYLVGDAPADSAQQLDAQKHPGLSMENFPWSKPGRHICVVNEAAAHEDHAHQAAVPHCLPHGPGECSHICNYLKKSISGTEPAGNLYSTRLCDLLIGPGSTYLAGLWRA
jgi:hypothetical protein